MTTLFDPPRIFELPFSKGGDLHFSFRYMPLIVDGDGLPVLDADGKRQYAAANYPAGATVKLVIETDDPAAPIVVAASILGSMATVWADTVVADAVASRKLWRVVITYADGLDQVLCNGKTSRYDGKG